MKLHTGMFYTYEDQYGWTVATFSDAPREAFFLALFGPRTFKSRAEAQRWIEEQVS